jgi:two-component system OmpR family sensor kinase
MTLRTRLVIWFTVLLVAVIVAVGLVATRSTRSILTSQIDRTLVGFVNRGPVPGPARTDGVTNPIGNQDEQPVLRQFAEAVIRRDGTVAFSNPSGFSDDPDPLPDFSGLTATTRGLISLSSVDGSLEYRAIVAPQPDGSIVVHAAPLRDVATATMSLLKTLLLAGGGVLLLGGAATWWAVRGTMRPVDEMVDTAEAIAGGDLTRRVPDLDASSELGRLGKSLNEMLAHIEEAVATERDSQQRLRQFVADASHELRTPVTAVSGYAELYRKGALDSPEAADKAWSRIDSESRRMGNLVEDLLMLARLGQSQPLHFETVDIAEIVRDAAADHSAIDPDRPVGVAAPPTLTIRGDRERLHQVASNLLSNVRVHTPPGTTVEIEARAEDDRVYVYVTDDGPGIPTAALGQIFNRFFRADPSRSRRSGGSGLGLAIVEAIVTAHRGSVSASNVTGKGARITVELPISADGREEV